MAVGNGSGIRLFQLLCSGHTVGGTSMQLLTSPKCAQIGSRNTTIKLQKHLRDRIHGI